MKGVSKAEQFRAKVSKINRYQVYSSRTRNQQLQNNQGKQRGGGGNMNTSWFGKGRGQNKQTNNTPQVKQIAAVEPAYGRGQWINAGE